MALTCLCGKKAKFKTSGAERTKRILIRKSVVWCAELGAGGWGGGGGLSDPQAEERAGSFL